LKHLCQMPITSKRIKILGYGSVALAGLNSVWLEMITSDYAHEVFSKYFFVELAILLAIFFTGLKANWAKILFGLLGLLEVWFVFEDTPISPDDLPMIIIFGLRVYAFALLLRANDA